MPSLLFPSVGHQVLSSLIHFLGVSILSHCISRRLAVEKFGTLDGLRNITWARFCLLIVLVDSWFFLFSSGILIFGIGLEVHARVCEAGVFACILLYATSKFFIYAYLIERVHAVWSPATDIKRFHSKMYIFCFATVLLYAVVIVLMIIGRDNSFRASDNVCLLGLRKISSYPLLIYDLWINVFLTTLFLYRLLGNSKATPRTRKIGRRALIAAFVALTTSTTNVVILAIVGGRELGWLCLGSCGIDVIINALSLFWATSTAPRESFNTYVGDSQFKTEPLPSILKRPSSPQAIPKAFSPSDTQYTCGPHRITSAYYRTSPASPVPSDTLISVERRPYAQDPAMKPSGSQLNRTDVLSDMDIKFQSRPSVATFDDVLDDEESHDHQPSANSSDIEISSTVYESSIDGDDEDHRHPLDGGVPV